MFISDDFDRANVGEHGDQYVVHGGSERLQNGAHHAVTPREEVVMRGTVQIGVTTLQRMGATVKKAYELMESYPTPSMLQQFENPANDKIYGVEPAESNILNGGKPGPHLITGNGVGFKPKILDMDVMEKVLEASYQLVLLSYFYMIVRSDDAVNMARELARKEGLLVGISSGANTVAALSLASKPENKGKLIVVCCFSLN
ncbi:L-3-cyanoalanine synthase 2, mitochondrial [Ananas comosus]|uniref:L-3-cyanoalanine synthase 2, mitochondrial n=1 Tax=Ananas comosus TaxID=4615 RepID=A0A199UE92_ANACO|nr:L-3-cyanoalanine synthase 2, mitochondrial [Ananas comosus]